MILFNNVIEMCKLNKWFLSNDTFSFKIVFIGYQLQYPQYKLNSIAYPIITGEKSIKDGIEYIIPTYFLSIHYEGITYDKPKIQDCKDLFYYIKSQEINLKKYNEHIKENYKKYVITSKINNINLDFE